MTAQQQPISQQHPRNVVRLKIKQEAQNLQQITEENEAGNDQDARDPRSDSTLEYIDGGRISSDSSEEDSQNSWVQSKKARTEIEKRKTEGKDDREIGRKRLSGLVASPTTRLALANGDFNRHQELTTQYLLRYNPEKINVLEVEAQAPVKAVEPKHAGPTKTRTPKEVERTIPRGRREEQDDDSDRERAHREPNDDEGSVEGDVVENGITFTSKKVPSHHMIQLTVFWDNRVRKVKGYVPVSIFNRAWLEANKDCESRKSTKSKAREKKSAADDEDESDEEENKGLKHPNELRLTYGDWVTAFNLMLDYLKHWYGYKTLAKNFQKHKGIVEEIKEENDDNWMVALRYDIMIRRQIWTTRVEGGGVGDPSVKQ
ncbi:hypothetical protein DFH28DRAFT_893669, partial [Melampsora americana]